MNTLIKWTVGVSLGLGWNAYGQWAVYDGAVHSQIIASSAEQVTKLVEQINHQVQEIKSLEEQLSTLKHYVDLFGVPGNNRTAINRVAFDLEKTELGKSLRSVLDHSSGENALMHDGGGLYLATQKEIPTTQGKSARDLASYKAFSPVQQCAANFVEVSQDVAQRRVAIKAEINTNLAALQAASTASEVAKITATLSAQTSALESLSQELLQAANAAVVQDIANRNDKARMEQALLEERHAQLGAALRARRAKFQLLTEPVHFPR